MRDKPTTYRGRFCPCCGQPLGLMSDAGWGDWLGKQIARLQLEGKPALADALARFVAAQYGEGIEP
jgi:hypothetical protein